MSLLLDKNWEIKMIDPSMGFSSEDLNSDLWIKAGEPRQVHSILLENGIIENSTEKGLGQELSWVAESDWIYKCDFEYSVSNKMKILLFEGLDTMVDI